MEKPKFSWLSNGQIKVHSFSLSHRHTHIYTHIYKHTHIQTHTQILFILKEGNSALYNSMDVPGRYIKWNEADTERQTIISLIYRF